MARALQQISAFFAQLRFLQEKLCQFSFDEFGLPFSLLVRGFLNSFMHGSAEKLWEQFEARKSFCSLSVDGFVVSTRQGFYKMAERHFVESKTGSVRGEEYAFTDFSHAFVAFIW